jgi:hypothetical protein
MDPEIQAQLKTCFAEDVRKLEDLLHRDLSRWKCQDRTRAEEYVLETHHPQ